MDVDKLKEKTTEKAMKQGAYSQESLIMAKVIVLLSISEVIPKLVDHFTKTK